MGKFSSIIMIFISGGLLRGLQQLGARHGFPARDWTSGQGHKPGQRDKDGK